MGNEDVGKKHDDQISKQKETLAKAKSVVQRPEEVSKSSTAPPPDRDYAAPPKFVTYPEFEPVVNSKATFLSLQRLLLVVYLSSGMAATIYAISKVSFLLRKLITYLRAAIATTPVAQVNPSPARFLSTWPGKGGCSRCEAFGFLLAVCALC